jgi:hypothetical protein
MTTQRLWFLGLDRCGGDVTHNCHGPLELSGAEARTSVSIQVHRLHLCQRWRQVPATLTRWQNSAPSGQGGSSGLGMLGLKLNGVVPKEEGDAATAIMRT